MTYFENRHPELERVRYLANRIDIMVGERMFKKQVKLKDVNEILYQAQSMVKTLTEMKEKLSPEKSKEEDNAVQD